MRACAMWFILLMASVQAEIVTDGSIGPLQQLQGPNYAIDAVLGQQHGANLFHSFRDFNVETEASATFSGPASVAHIIGRVTGGSGSKIDGMLRSTIDGADLYLINPAGWLFGPHARLEITGSFYAGSAAAVKFADGARFNADTPSTFTAAPPTAFGFLDPGPVTVQGSTLQVAAGNTLALVGGGMDIKDGEIHAPDGRLVLASVSSAGEIQLAEAHSNAAGGDLHLHRTIATTNGTSGGAVFVHAGPFEMRDSEIAAETLGTRDGQGIQVQAERLVLREGAQIYTSTTGAGRGGDLSIHAGDSVRVTGESAETFSGLGAFTSGVGDAGAVNIRSGRLEVSEGGGIIGSTHGAGNGGAIHIRADSVRVQGASTRLASGISAGAASDSSGDAGDMLIETGVLEVLDGAQIDVATFGPGRGGNLTIEAGESVRVEGENDLMSFSGISAQTNSTGEAGNLFIATPRLELHHSGQIDAATFSDGPGGNLTIKADEIVVEGGAVIGATSFGDGNGGHLDIEADSLQVLNSGLIDSSTWWNGDGGNLTIKVDGHLRIEGGPYSSLWPVYGNGGIFAVAATVDRGYPGGNAGDLSISAGSVEIRNGGQIAAWTMGDGRGGDLNIHSAGTVHLAGQDEEGASSMINVAGWRDDGGAAGNITLQAAHLYLNDGAGITSQTDGPDGGDIAITVPGKVYLHHSNIFTAAGRPDDTAQSVQGNGGNISISPGFIILDHGRIKADAYEGNGGNIHIQTRGIYQFDTRPLDEVITASSEKGISGKIRLESPETDIGGSLNVLPTGFIDPAALQQTPCTPQRAAAHSRFIVKRYAGKRAAPDDWRSGRCVLQ